MSDSGLPLPEVPGVTLEISSCHYCGDRIVFNPVTRLWESEEDFMTACSSRGTIRAEPRHVPLSVKIDEVKPIPAGWTWWGVMPR